MTAPAPRRFLWLLGPVAAFAVTFALLSAAQGGGEAAAPSLQFDRPGPATVDAAPGATTEERIAATLEAAEREPGDAALQASLGDLYYQRGRETADSTFNERAHEAYSRSLAIDPDGPQATLGLGTLALAKHDFAGGLRLGKQALALEPKSAQPYAAIVDGQVELGRYGAAARTLERMVSLKPNLASYSRISYYRELHGGLEGALRAMRLAVSAGGGAPENVAYVQSLFGQLLFQSGDVEAAGRAFRTALARVPDNLPAAVGVATVQAANGNLDEAIRGYRQAVEVSAVHEYSVLLLEAELAAGHMAAARREIAATREAQALERSRGVNTDAELAIFEAEHGSPARAVELGRAAVRVAPSVSSADALGWALTNAGRPKDAVRWAKQALRTGWSDPLPLYHAGMAAKAAGRNGLARRWLGQALARNPRFSPLHAPRARSALRAVS